MTVQITRKIAIYTTNVLDSAIDLIPNKLRSKVSKYSTFAVSCIGIVVPLLYAATNKRSSFICR